MDGEWRYSGKEEEGAWSEGTVYILIAVVIIQIDTGIRIYRTVHHQKNSISPYDNLRSKIKKTKHKCLHSWKMRSILHTETNKTQNPSKSSCHNSCVCVCVCDMYVSACMNPREKRSVSIMYNLHEYGVKREAVPSRLLIWIRGQRWSRDGAVSMRWPRMGESSIKKREKVTNYNLKGAAIIWSYLCKVMHIRTCIDT